MAYQGPDAKQIASDGQDVYWLRQNGNIYRISDTGLTLADMCEREIQCRCHGTGTRQILPAGGILYIVKNNGNIWAYQTISGSPAFQIADPGTGSSQIESSGEILYVLKENGNIWKSVVCSAGENSPLELTNFVRVDDGTDTKQLSSSGSILYILKKAGNILEVRPALGQSRPAQSARVRGFRPT
jgi:hypothetical protein